jgi:hypothetical protein
MKRIFMRGGTGAITWTTVTGLAASLDPRTLEAPLLRADAHRSGGSLAVHFVKVPYLGPTRHHLLESGCAPLLVPLLCDQVAMQAADRLPLTSVCLARG